MKCCSFFIVISLLGKLCFGQQIETDRPDQTEASSTIPKGTFQLESGVGIENLKTPGTTNGLGEHTLNSIVMPTTLFRLSLINRLELRLVNTLRFNSIKNEVSHLDRGFGIDDLEAGFKWQLTGENVKGIQLSLMSHLVIPTGSDGNKAFGMVNKLLISHDLTDKISLGYNLGHVYFGAGKGDFVYSVALGFTLTDKLGCYIENYGGLDDFSTFKSNVDGGITYLLMDNLQLDYSFGVGIHDRMNYQAVGVSFRIPK